jgi:membrane-associated phospholipid phosphatase
LVIGATFGGLVLGALIVTFFFYLWRRRAQRKARRSQGLLVPNQDKGSRRNVWQNLR